MNTPSQNQNTTPSKGHPQQEQSKLIKDRQPGSDTATTKPADAAQTDGPADSKNGQSS